MLAARIVPSEEKYNNNNSSSRRRNSRGGSLSGAMSASTVADYDHEEGILVEKDNSFLGQRIRIADTSFTREEDEVGEKDGIEEEPERRGGEEDEEEDVFLPPPPSWFQFDTAASSMTDMGPISAATFGPNEADRDGGKWERTFGTSSVSGNSDSCTNNSSALFGGTATSSIVSKEFANGTTDSFVGDTRSCTTRSVHFHSSINDTFKMMGTSSAETNSSSFSSPGDAGGVVSSVYDKIQLLEQHNQSQTQKQQKQQQSPFSVSSSSFSIVQTSSPSPPSASPPRHQQNSHYRGGITGGSNFAVGSPNPSPSWHQQATEILPAAARELVSSSLHRVYYYTRLSYALRGCGRWYRRHSDMGYVGGYFRANLSMKEKDEGQKSIPEDLLPPFSSLPWVDRQLVREWRTCDHTFAPRQLGKYKKNREDDNDGNDNDVLLSRMHEENISNSGTTLSSTINKDKNHEDETLIDEELDTEFTRARTLIPQPKPRPIWSNSDFCYKCHKTFGPTLLRHHCRMCGESYCHPHSSYGHKLPHLGYDPDVPERVCDACKKVLDSRDLAERIAWRLARCRDYISSDLTPYFETGLDTMEDAALRITRAAIAMARSIPLGAQAHVAVETIEVLRKHGLKGVYGLVLRKEFMAAADLLCKALGINRTAWPLSVHELSAAIFYALAQHRYMRGMDPEREHRIHSLREEQEEKREAVEETKDDEQAQHGKNNISTGDGGICMETEQPSHICSSDERWVKSEEEKFDSGDDWGPFLSAPMAMDGSAVLLPPIQEAVANNTDDDREEEDGGDTIVWGNHEAGDDVVWKRRPGFETKCDKRSNSSSILLDETDTYDPMAESVADLIAMADQAIQSQVRKQNGSKIAKNVEEQAAVVTYGENDAMPCENVRINSDEERSDGNEKIAAKEPSAAEVDSTSSIGVTQVNIGIDKKDAGFSDPIPRKLQFTPVCDPVSDSLLSSLILYAPLALNFIYATKEVDMQLLAAQQGWRLLYAHLEQDHGSSADGSVADRPASALFVHSERKIACLAIRGTATIHDVVTDIRAMPVPFPETAEAGDGMSGATSDDDWTHIFSGNGLALCGIAGAALNLFRENIEPLLFLAQQGYRIRITGHSLGGGVAALLGTLVLRHLERRAREGDLVGAAELTEQSKETVSSSESRSISETNDLLRVYGYGTPSCVDAKLSDYCRKFVTTVVLHDDVVPRLTPTSIRGLLKHLLHIRETWVKAHLASDLMAITKRARTAWAPRLRGSFTLLHTSSSSLKGYCKKKIQRKLRALNGNKKGPKILRDERTVVFEDAGGQYNLCTRAYESRSESEHSEFGGIRNLEQTESIKCIGGRGEYLLQLAGFSSFSNDPSKEEVNGENEHQDEDGRQGIYVDGDEFFEAEENLIESDEESIGETLNEEGEGLSRRRNVGSRGGATPHCNVAEDDNEWVPFDEPPLSSHPKSAVHSPGKHETDGESRADSNSGCADFVSREKERTKTRSPPAVVLEETPLPRMFLPGKIVHVYTHRGAFKAAFVPRAFRELRRVSLAGNMLTDHTSKAYYEGLLEVMSVRNAEEDLPRWTSFDEDSTCSCCASRFTWASTSDSEAQEARDKHNCRSCGSLVCNPCSKNRIPLPTIGITVPVRVCDRCYNDMGGILTGNALTQSFLDEKKKEGMEHDEGEGVVGGGSPDRIGESKANVPAEQFRPTSKCGVEATAAASSACSKPQRQRDRRSIVVDELASRLPSSFSS